MWPSLAKSRGREPDLSGSRSERSATGSATAGHRAWAARAVERRPRTVPDKNGSGCPP